MGSTQYLHTATPSAPGISPYVGSGVVGAVANFWATKFGKALEAGVRRYEIMFAQSVLNALDFDVCASTQ
jgi:hypothetical protein